VWKQLPVDNSIGYDRRYSCIEFIHSQADSVEKKMDALKIRIDGKEITGSGGMTILQAADKAGINIPTLCYHRDLIPSGACRICVVEIEGSSRLIGSCHTPIAEGMAVHTRSPKVILARKAIIELLLAGHTGPCVTDQRAAQCDLHKIASDLEVGPPRFRVKRPRFYPIESASPYVRRDLSKCILCSRCINVCNDLAGKRVYGAGYRAFQSKVVVDCDIPLDKEICRDCRLCIEYCPTSALTKPDSPGDKKRDGHPAPETNRQQDLRRGRLLPELKKAQDSFRHVSPDFIAKTAESLNLSIGDVYGVSSFYSFLSTQPAGQNVIRVCRSLPCHLKGAPMIAQSIKEELGIGPGETTPDGRFSFTVANCIGACDQAPAMLINHEVYGNLTPARISQILKAYR
jgi:NADH:ubiquinone oxidoreductase subunit E/NAD-dependent dihydropyrimidine dehydrogenase PreA subunit